MTRKEAEALAEKIADTHAFTIIYRRVMTMLDHGEFDLIDVDVELGRLLTVDDERAAEERRDQVGEIIKAAEEGGR